MLINLFHGKKPLKKKGKQRKKKLLKLTTKKLSKEDRSSKTTKGTAEGRETSTGTLCKFCQIPDPLSKELNKNKRSRSKEKISGQMKIKEEKL